MDEAIEEAVQAGLTALDFCGNVNEAIAQVAADNSITFTAQQVADIKGRIYGAWATSRKRAGVNPRKRSGFTENLLFR